MINWLILLAKQYIDIIKYLLMADALFNLKYDKKKKLKEIFVLSIITLLIYLLLFNYIETIWVDLNLIICLIFMIIILRTNIFTLLKYISMSLAVVTLLEQFVDIVIDYNILNFKTNKFIILNILRFILIVITYSLIKMFKLQRNYDLNNLSSYIYMNIVFAFSATIFPLIVVKTFNNKLKDTLSITISIISYINIVISIISIYLFVKNKNEKDKYYLDNLFKDKTIKLQEEYYQKLIDNYSSLREFKHDIKGHYHVLDKLLKSNNYQEASDYLENINEKISGIDVYSSNNIYISAILNSFDNQFKDNNVRFDFSYSVAGYIVMDNMDICTLFYNLINNALEANLKIDNNRFISLKIANIKNNLFIEIINPLKENKDIKYIETKISSKEDDKNHGIGLLKINEIINRYDGNNNYQVINTHLINKIILLDVIKYD